MRHTIIAAAIAVMCSTAAHAFVSTAPGLDHFKFNIGLVGDSPQSSGQWLALLPDVADQCGMKVVRSQLQNVLSDFRDVDVVVNAANRMQNGFPNSLKNDWDIMTKDDHDAACKIANDLWGEDGTQFPGLLRAL